MLTENGQILSIPQGVTGLPSSAPTGASRGTGTGGTNRPPSNSSSASGTTSAGKDGIGYEGGAAYLVRNGQATRLDREAVADGQMMTWDGKTVPAPQGVTGLPPASTGQKDNPSNNNNNATSPSGPAGASSGTGTSGTNRPPSNSSGNSGTVTPSESGSSPSSRTGTPSSGDAGSQGGTAPTNRPAAR